MTKAPAIVAGHLRVVRDGGLIAVVVDENLVRLGLVGLLTGCLLYTSDAADEEE